MKVTCIVQNERREVIEGASVKLFVSKKDSYELQYDVEARFVNHKPKCVGLTHFI
jgi:hypothetical protein